MTAAEVRSEILDILSNILPDHDLSNLDDNTPLNEQLALDSMDMLDIVLELRKRYRIHVPEDDYGHLMTMSSTVRYVQPRMPDLNVQDA